MRTSIPGIPVSGACTIARASVGAHVLYALLALQVHTAVVYLLLRYTFYMTGVPSLRLLKLLLRLWHWSVLPAHQYMIFTVFRNSIGTRIYYASLFTLYKETKTPCISLESHKRNNLPGIAYIAYSLVIAVCRPPLLD